MISRNGIRSQIIINFISCELIPSSSTIYIGPVAVPGVDDPGGRHSSASGIQGQSAAVEADGDFTIQGDLAAFCLNQAVILLAVCRAIFIDMAEIGTDRIALRICLAVAKGPFAIPFGISLIAGICHRTTGSGGEISPIGVDIRIDDDSPDFIPVAVRIQDYVQFVGRGGDIAVDGDIPHSIQGQRGIIP